MEVNLSCFGRTVILKHWSGVWNMSSDVPLQVSCFRFQNVMIPADSNGISKEWKVGRNLTDISVQHLHFIQEETEAKRSWKSGPGPGDSKFLTVSDLQSPRMKSLKFSDPLWSNGGLAVHSNRISRFPGRGTLVLHSSCRNRVHLGMQELTITLKVSQLLEATWSEKQSWNFFSGVCMINGIAELQG